MKKFKNESKSKSPMKITLFVMIFFMIIGFSSLSITRFITGGVNLGFNFDDVNIYIANLYTNNINRFNSISEDKTSFNIELQNGTNNVDIYISNNSTQYDEYINFVCNESDLNGVSITPNEDNTNIVYSQVILKNTFVIENTGGTQTLNCRLENLEVESTTKVVEKKRVIFALDGFENETAFKYVDSLTYGELPIIKLDGYEFLGWYNSNDELVESTTEITNFSDEILYGKLESLCILGKVWNFDYTGGEQTFTAPCDGEYKLETWGAQGGNANTTYIGGYGGYSVGLLELESRNLFINVGGKGNVSSQSNNVLGGYNGGGASGYITSSGFTYGSGGGATHISLESGVLSDLSKYSLNNNSPIIIVAGGGGGGGYRPTNPIVAGIGGSGGGYIGQNGTGVNWAGQGTGGNQSSGGYTMTESTYIATFGKGGERPQNAFSGGGGGYFGGGAGDWTGAGGGSGYIGNTSLTDKVMYCYNCEESNEESTKTVSTTCTNVTPTENCAKQGNGYARITYLGKKYTITNMVEDSSFENGVNRWLNNTGTVTKSNEFKDTGNYSMKFASNAYYNETLAYYCIADTKTAKAMVYTKGHKYYGRVITYIPSTYSTTHSEMFWHSSGKIMTTAYFTYSKVGQKSLLSFYIDKDWDTDNNMILRLDNNNLNKNSVVYFDSIVLMDLTEAFGEGNEPSKEWCDEHIGWFEGSKIVYK